MAYWLMKSEPEDYSWQQLVADGETEWSGVRSHQAAGNMRAMRRGEQVFFYHSGKAPGIVGVMQVSQEWYPDPDDPSGKFCRVRVKPVRPTPREVSLQAIKAEPALEGLTLIRQSRLSVVPVSDAHWRTLCAMAGLEG